jgi:hypothetical protein
MAFEASGYILNEGPVSKNPERGGKTAWLIYTGFLFPIR